jgi:hypothetical protein
VSREASRPLALGIVVAAAVCLGAARAEGQDLSIRLTPEVIQMGTFASGARLRIEGTVAANAQAVVVITGRDTDEIFNRKGRVGPIWVNSGKVQVAGVPSLFLAFSPAPLGAFLGREAIERWQLDEAAIKRRVRVRPAAADRPAVRDGYVALKVEEGSYRAVTDAVRMEKGAGGAATYAVELLWPKTAPPGSYQATVYECRDKAVTRAVSTSVEVREVGLAAGMRHLADDHAPLYGAIAVVVMMALGFGIDFLVAWFRHSRPRRPGRPADALAHKDVAVH